MSRQIQRLGLSKNVEVPIMVNTRTRFNFSDSIVDMDRVLIHALSINTKNGKTPEFRTALPIILAMGCYLNLAGYENQQFNMRLPFQLFKLKKNPFIPDPPGFEGLFNPSFTFDPFFFKPRLVSLRKSSVDFPAVTGTIIPADGYGLTLTFFYEPYNEAEHKLTQWGELINAVDYDF